MRVVPDLAKFRIPSSIEDVEVPTWISDIKAEDFPEFVTDVVRAYLYGLRSKIGTCIKEASERAYSLELAVEAEMLPWAHVKAVYEECKELLTVLKHLQEV